MHTLTTSRLVMNMHREEDLADYAALLADSGVMRHLGGRPFTRSESWARLLRDAGSWALLGLGSWAVRDARSGRLVGSVGFLDARREIVPRLDGIPELGWVLASWAQGRDLATEAVQASLAWGDAHLAHPRTICLIDAENAASLRVAGKAGFRFWQQGRMADSDPLIFVRDRPA